MTRDSTLRRDRRTGYYVTADGRYSVTPAYGPSIRGGSVTRPSYWILTDRTGAYSDVDRRTLADIREVIAGRYAR